MRRWVAAFVLAMTPLATASAGWWDDLDKGEPVRLSDLTAQADRWKGKVVTFACIYHKFDSVFQPYFTSFNPEKWLNATAWYDGAPIWEKDVFTGQDFPFLYLEQTHPQRDEMIAMQPYTRIEITGRVKDVYRQHPFIEILGFHATPATFGKSVVEWMLRGDTAASVGDYTRAEANYRLVLAQVTLDETTRLRAQKRLDDALRAAGRPMAAAEEKAGPVHGGSSMPKPRRGAAPAAGDTAGAPDAGPAPAGGDPFARGSETPVSRVPGGRSRPGAAPSELTTEDLPGTPVDSHPGSAAPALPGPALPEPDPARGPLPPAAGSPPAGAPRATAPACPPAAPGSDVPSDATPPACPPGDAVPPPPPSGAPPPRSPRLSGVR